MFNMDKLQHGNFKTFFEAAGLTKNYVPPKGSVYDLTLRQARAVDRREFQIESVAGENILLRTGRIFSCAIRGNTMGD